ncbi:MAG TPA: flagellar basal body P-ring formation chaperone FlgA [Steroidobacteraceae bacterium]|nr:flagellar basal body P-ring formation chaperone FlgA [Steroidobacteraceae bacterium]
MNVPAPRLPLASALAALAALALLAIGATAAADDALEDPARLAAVARAAAARESGRPEAELEVGAIDPRLRLAACRTAPGAQLTPGTRSSTQLTVEIRCTSPPWRQFVAVRIRAQEPVVIAARPLGRLQVVAIEDLAVVPRDLASVPAGYFRRAEDVVGRIAQRTIGSGEVLLPATVRPPPLVHRGQSVTVLAHAGGMSVRTAGVVLADAGLAERVQVRNAASGRLIEGVVRSSDTVEVALE